MKDSILESEEYPFRVSVAKSRRLPQLQVGVLAGELLHSIDFTFPQGAFGTYPATGPIPSTEAKVRSPAQFTTFITGSSICRCCSSTRWPRDRRDAARRDGA